MHACEETTSKEAVHALAWALCVEDWGQRIGDKGWYKREMNLSFTYEHI